MFVLKILGKVREKIKIKLLRFFQGSIIHIHKLKSTARNKTRATSRITKKNFQDEEVPHELFLTTRKKTKIINAFANTMSTNIKLSKAQLTKIILSGEFLGNYI